MSPEDALKIKDEGVDAIQVSNHGGRQLDSATAAIEALPVIRNTLGKEFPLLFDSGVRGGSDIIRALALGANYVMLGRPLMYGIGADGEKGLRRILDIIKESLSKSANETFSVADNLSIPLREARENFEKEYLISQIKKFGGNISKTAKFVGMERSALHRKLKLLGVKDLN